MYVCTLSYRIAVADGISVVVYQFLKLINVADQINEAGNVGKSVFIHYILRPRPASNT